MFGEFNLGESAIILSLQVGHLRRLVSELFRLFSNESE